MSLTLTQAFHRTQDLGGLIKAGESALADCEADAEAKQRIASIAVEGVDKAKANLAALKQERSDLAEHMKALVEQVGEAAPGGDGGSGGIAVFGGFEAAEVQPFADFGHPTQNGLDVSAVNAAYDRSTHP